MATETLNPNAVGTSNGYALSAGSGDAAKVALVNDGDDTTYAYASNFVELAQKWYIRIDGGYIQDAGGEPGAGTGTSATALTRVINSTNFSGCPTLTKALITSLEIGLYSGTASFVNSQTFNLDDPTFPDGATINSVTINGRLSFASYQTRIHEISLVVDYTEPASTEQTLLKLESGSLILKGGTLIIK
jgi:hypothetical protein